MIPLIIAKKFATVNAIRVYKKVPVGANPFGNFFVMILLYYISAGNIC